MPFSPAAQAALLKWVNTFPVSTPAESMNDLADGITLSQILHDLDPSYDTSELDANTGSSRWLTQKRNLQSVYKGLVKYMRRDAPECVPLVKVADFRTVAENPDAAGLSQLVAVFLATAVFNSNEGKRLSFINKLQSEFGPAEQNEIRRIVEEKQGQMKELAEAASLEDARDRDPDLEDEEERLKLVAELEKKVRELDTATKRYADLNTRHSYLQESHDEIKAKLAEVEGELEDLRKLHGADESQRVQALQRKIEEQASLIAGQEEAIDAYQTHQRQLEVEVERYKASSADSQEYKDRYDELHHQMQDLERRANAADRYKQKLAAQRNLEQEVASLQYELEARKELDDKLQRALIERDRLQATEKEMLAAMTTIEQSLNDERDRKDHYRELYEELRTEFAQLEHQNTVNERYIEDIKEMGAGGELPRPSSSGAAEASLGNLEQELQQTTNDFSKVKLLEAEIEVLRHSAATSSQSDDLRRELERMKTERDIAMKKYETIFEKHGVAQEQIEALIKNMTGEGLVNGLEEALHHGSLASLTSDFYRHVAFQNLRESNHKTQQDLDELRTKLRKLEEAAKDKDRDMLAMKTDLDAVGEDRLSGLERLKQSDQLIAASLRAELETLRARYNNLEVENNMHKAQLLEALVAKEKLSKEKDSEPSETATTASGVDPAVQEEALKSYKSKSDKLRERVKQQKEVKRGKSLLLYSSSAPPTMIDLRGSPDMASSTTESWSRTSSVSVSRSVSILGLVREELSGSSSTLTLPPPVMESDSRPTVKAEDHIVPTVLQHPPLTLRQVTPPPEMIAFQQGMLKHTTQLEKQDQERYELQKRIKALESGSALAAQKAAHEQIIKNLQRENAMISTAWYDLTSRLQSNHVVLQRRDQPRSWLNKQRQMVNVRIWDGDSVGVRLRTKVSHFLIHFASGGFEDLHLLLLAEAEKTVGRVGKRKEEAAVMVMDNMAWSREKASQIMLGLILKFEDGMERIQV
ncbi:hypothetical protein M406DRAFT_351398 [Cryphonectria parasitica EP155]|uniref:HOOK N-terminal domain-containing protein n=1 Tax=Cryphonectria parasitica (strain ATCC 38755 / EP155) TaxID=660469 RepID=A0A9P5CQI6_CRYP1|nr:uncharacterized protein M406DRAFT_351398 [Cryphonectria parasitica EP155]KAF3766251.1 hypothetical protein M406DRAFT_351398 [Cryphonectria parasitica EP155]